MNDLLAADGTRLIQLEVVATGVAVAVGLIVHGHDVADLSQHGVAETSLMAAAMMLPVTALTVPLVMRRNLVERRGRAVAEHLSGFAVVWAAFGLGAALIVVWGRGLAGAAMLFALGCAVAVAWQLSARRVDLARRCGRLRCAPLRGWRQAAVTVQGGADHGTRCVRTCGPAMVAMLAAPSAAAMVAVWLASLWQWIPGPSPHLARGARRSAIVYGAAGAVVLVAAAVPG